MAGLSRGASSAGGGGWWARGAGGRSPAVVAAAAASLAVGVAVGAALPVRRRPLLLPLFAPAPDAASEDDAQPQPPGLPLRPLGTAAETLSIQQQQQWTAAASASSAANAAANANGPVTREALGRATWTLLHTLAARFPDRPTRRQRRDAEALVDALTRVYPCGECAAHFAALCARDPPDASSGAALRAWACRAHNAVNARLGKPAFDCALAAARWAPEACDGPTSGQAGKGGDACAMGVGAAAAAVGARAVADASRGGRARW